MIEPFNEQGVVYRFIELSTSTGFQIIEVGTRYPDAMIEKDGQQYRVEFEFKSSNFWVHKHNPEYCDLIICWRDDDYCPILPIIALSNPSWYHREIILVPHHEKTLQYWRSRALDIEEKFNLSLPKQVERQDSIRYWKSRCLQSEWSSLHNKSEPRKAIPY